MMKRRKFYYDVISFRFVSYSKFSFAKRKLTSRKTQKLLLIFWLLKKYRTTLNVRFRGLKKISKFFVLLSSPKCYKVGKIILKYQLFKYVITLNKRLNRNNKIHNLADLNFFLKCNLELLKFFDSNYALNNRVKFLLATRIF